MVEMCVHMDCTCVGCEKQIRKALLKVKGVDYVYIDMVTQKVTATGRWVDQKKALKAVKKTGRTAVLWPSTYSVESYINGYDNQQYSGYNNQQCYNHKRPKSHTEQRSTYAAQPHAYASSSSYNSMQQGYAAYHDSNMYGGNQMPQYMHEENEMKLFSDDNANSCAIM